jgi:hypothetical protein
LKVKKKTNHKVLFSINPILKNEIEKTNVAKNSDKENASLETN